MQSRQLQGHSPDISIEFDKDLKVWVGEVITRNGPYYAQGPDEHSVAIALELRVDQEYRELMRELEEERARLNASGKDKESREPSQSKPKKQKKAKPKQVKEKDASPGVVSEMTRAVGLILLTLLGVHTRFFGFLNRILGLGNQRAYATNFCGEKITAGSMRQLQKKIMMARNRRIFRIMEHVRKHSHNLHIARNDIQSRVLDRKTRLKRRRELSMQSWQDRVGGKRDVKKDLNKLRSRIKTNRSQARDMWMR